MKQCKSKVNGHYQISLPWRPRCDSLLKRNRLSKTRLAYLQNRLGKDRYLKAEYIEASCRYLFDRRSPTSGPRQRQWKVSLLDRCQTQIFLAVTGLWSSGKVSLFASKKFCSNVVATSHSSCVFLYLFSSANMSPVRFVLHLQDWWCVGKGETSFPVNKLWLISLLPSLWPLTMKNRYACKF